MRQRGCDHALVNTSVRNEGALGLYEKIGFLVLAEQLTIAEIDVGSESR
jgi:ribosomal protein S18 acetylase RimI-like enzyme